MKKLLIILLLAAVVALVIAATKEELMAKKMAFKKGKGKPDGKQHHLDEIQKLKQMNLSPKELRKRIAQLDSKGPVKKTADKTDMDAVIHKRKVAEDREKAKAELEAAEKQFRKEFSQLRYQPNMNVKEKQRKMIAMKQDFMANVSDLKERMGFDTSKTDRMAWKQAQMKKRPSIKL